MLLQFPQSLKVPTKIDHHFHYLEIQAIESKKPNQVVFKWVETFDNLQREEN